jgi:hypothetical protein
MGLPIKKPGAIAISASAMCAVPASVPVASGKNMFVMGLCITSWVVPVIYVFVGRVAVTSVIAVRTGKKYVMGVLTQSTMVVHVTGASAGLRVIIVVPVKSLLLKTVTACRSPASVTGVLAKRVARVIVFAAIGNMKNAMGHMRV